MATTYYVNTVFSAGDRMTPALSRMGAAVKSFEDRAKSSAKSLGNTFSSGVAQATAALGAAGLTGMLTKAVTLGAEFEHTLVSAGQKFEIPINKGTAAFERLADVAKQIGGTTQFSAQDAAAGLSNLAASGYDAEQAIAALPKIAQLAVANNLSLAEATSMASDALNAIGKNSTNAAEKAENLANMSDMMTAASNAANMEFRDMFAAMGKLGPTAVGLEMDMNQVAGAVAALADTTIKGAEGGNALSSVITKLLKPVGEGKDAMAALRITVQKNAKGGVDLAKTLELVKAKTLKLSVVERGRALAAIFGQEQLDAGNALLAMSGEKLDKYTAAARDATGTTARMAAQMQNTTQGAIDGLSSAVESLFLSLSEKLGNTKGNLDGFASIILASGSFVWGFVQVLGFLAGALVVAKVATIAFHVAQIALAVAMNVARVVMWAAHAAAWAFNAILWIGTVSNWRYAAAIGRANAELVVHHITTAIATVKMYAMAFAAIISAGGFWGLAAAVWAAIAPFVIGVVVIMAIVGALILLYQNSETVRNIVDTVWNGIKTAITSAIDFVMGPINWLLDAFGLISSGLDDMQNAAGAVGTSMGDLPQNPFLDGGNMTLSTDGGPDIGGQLAGASPGNGGTSGFAGTLDMSLIAPAGYGVTTAANLPPGINVQQSRTGGF